MAGQPRARVASEPVKGLLSTLPARGGLGGNGQYGVFGFEHRLATAGMRSTLLVADSAAAANSRLETCAYVDAESGELGYSPGCPGASTSFDVTVTSARADSRTLLASTAFQAAPALYGLGGNITEAGAGAALTAVGL